MSLKHANKITGRAWIEKRGGEHPSSTFDRIPMEELFDDDASTNPIRSQMLSLIRSQMLSLSVAIEVEGEVTYFVMRRVMA